MSFVQNISKPNWAINNSISPLFAEQIGLPGFSMSSSLSQEARMAGLSNPPSGYVPRDPVPPIMQSNYTSWGRRGLLWSAINEDFHPPSSITLDDVNRIQSAPLDFDREPTISSHIQNNNEQAVQEEALQPNSEPSMTDIIAQNLNTETTNEEESNLSEEQEENTNESSLETPGLNAYSISQQIGQTINEGFTTYRTTQAQSQFQNAMNNGYGYGYQKVATTNYSNVMNDINNKAFIGKAATFLGGPLGALAVNLMPNSWFGSSNVNLPANYTNYADPSVEQSEESTQGIIGSQT